MHVELAIGDDARPPTRRDPRLEQQSARTGLVRRGRHIWRRHAVGVWLITLGVARFVEFYGIVSGGRFECDHWESSVCGVGVVLRESAIPVV